MGALERQPEQYSLRKLARFLSGMLPNQAVALMNQMRSHLAMPQLVLAVVPDLQAQRGELLHLAETSYYVRSVSTARTWSTVDMYDCLIIRNTGPSGDAPKQRVIVWGVAEASDNMFELWLIDETRLGALTNYPDMGLAPVTVLDGQGVPTAAGPFLPAGIEAKAEDGHLLLKTTVASAGRWDPQDLAGDAFGPTDPKTEFTNAIVGSSQLIGRSTDGRFHHSPVAIVNPGQILMVVAGNINYRNFFTAVISVVSADKAVYP